MTSLKKVLVGACGLRCDICTMYRAYHDQNLELLTEAPENFRTRLEIPKEVKFEDIACEGCRSSTLFKYCAECSLKDCISKKGVDWCYECEDFPCESLSDWQARWRMPVITNLNEIKKMGVEKWLKIKEEMWICPKCETRLHWFSFGICPSCGEEIPES